MNTNNKIITPDFKKIILSNEYDFLRTNEHLGDSIILLTLGGSYAYGTNKEGSDIDIRGVALERPHDLIGFSEFEQVVETNTDTTIYAFNKMVKLLISNNPNTIEILGCKPEHYLFVAPEGQLLLDNKKLFLSRNCINAFVGYSNAQLARLENALARDRLSQMKKEEHIANSIRNAMMTFKDRYTAFEGNNGISLSVGESKKADLESEMFLDINLSHYPLRDFCGAFNEMQSILHLYGKLNHRNKKKDDNHLDKHAMHLIRLYLMALDILEKEDIITYRGADLELLMHIRNGGFRREDGTYDDSFFDLLEDFKKRLLYAIDNTSLPSNPQIKEIEEIVYEVNKKIILSA